MPGAPVTAILPSRSSIIVSMRPVASSALSVWWIATGSIRLAGDRHGPMQKLLSTATPLSR